MSTTEKAQWSPIQGHRGFFSKAAEAPDMLDPSIRRAVEEETLVEAAALRMAVGADTGGRGRRPEINPVPQRWQRRTVAERFVAIQRGGERIRMARVHEVVHRFLAADPLLQQVDVKGWGWHGAHM